jgi:N-acetylmuramoyl-L-alanine amidase
MIFRLFFCAVMAVFAIGPAQAQSPWELVKRNDQEFVTLRSFCKFYKVNYESPQELSQIRCKNNRTTFLFKKNSRELMINGGRYWLSFPVVEDAEAKDWLISRVDLVKLFEPVLRPWMVPQKRIVRGVVVDAGHGGEDKGAVSRRGNLEKDYALDTAQRLEKLLKEQKIPVVMTRGTDQFVPLTERAQIASRYTDFIFVSLHYNSARQAARGLETYCLTPRGAGSTQAEGQVERGDFQRLPGNANDIFNVLLADQVHRQIIKLNPGDIEADRGLKRARFVVLKEPTIPAILVEGGFLSNRMESAVIDTPAYRQKLAAAVLEGILVYIQMMNPKPTATPTPIPTKTLTPTPPSEAKAEAEVPEPVAPTRTPAAPSPSSLGEKKAEPRIGPVEVKKTEERAATPTPAPNKPIIETEPPEIIYGQETAP